MAWAEIFLWRARFLITQLEYAGMSHDLPWDDRIHIKAEKPIVPCQSELQAGTGEF